MSTENIYELNYLKDLIKLDFLKDKNKNKQSIWTSESGWIFKTNFVYSFQVKIADNDNNIIIITTDIKDNIHLLPKSINDIIKKHKLLQDFIKNYDDEYYLFIDITYFDNYTEKFFIQVFKLKEMFFDIDAFISEKHNINYYNLEDYLKKIGCKDFKIDKKYNSIDKDSYEDDYTKYIEFYVDKIKIRGYFHDISSYDKLEPPYAKFSIIK